MSIEDDEGFEIPFGEAEMSLLVLAMMCAIRQKHKA